MKFYWSIKKDENSKLLLLFNGWGCDENILQGIAYQENYDVLLLSEYNSMDETWLAEVQKYEEIKLVAWSFGVYMANFYLPYLPNVVCAVAVNGSVYPIDDAQGIPQHIFEGTLATYNDATRTRFFRRMVGGAKNLKLYETLLPQRTTESQKEELAFFGVARKSVQERSPKWTKAVLAQADAIFPIDNLIQAWSGVEVKVLDAPHFIPFQQILTAYV